MDSVQPNFNILYSDILDASQRLARIAVRTPLIDCPETMTGGRFRLLIKAEIFQRTGSFKFRGSYNFISRLHRSVRQNGVVAFSSGNHSQAVAAVANLFNISSTIVMPSDAPEIKIKATRQLGAKIILYDRYMESREEIAEKIVLERGATLVPPFDHPIIITGQGTVGLEICEQLTQMNLKPDVVLIPCSGGGLTAGIAIAMKQLAPNAEVFTVEPTGFDDTARSFISGRRESAGTTERSVCDALLVPTPGQITFPINRQLVRRGLVVNDTQTLGAMAIAFLYLKLVLEPGGAIALAAALNDLVDLTDKVVVAVCSGGNVDPNLFNYALKKI